MNEILQNLDWSVLTDALLGIIPALLCVTVHETCHGLCALALGDDTAKRQGRLTLNPLKHVDVFGLVMMAALHFGWAKPVPVNMYRFRSPKWGMALTALAGPVSNLVLGVLFLFLYGLLYTALYASSVGYYVLEMLYLTAELSISLAIFNCIPIPPLDGSKLLFAVLPDGAYDKLMRYEKYGMVLLAVILLTGTLSSPLYRAEEWCMSKLITVAGWGYTLTGGVI